MTSAVRTLFEVPLLRKLSHQPTEEDAVHDDNDGVGRAFYAPRCDAPHTHIMYRRVVGAETNAGRKFTKFGRTFGYPGDFIGRPCFGFAHSFSFTGLANLFKGILL